MNPDAIIVRAGRLEQGSIVRPLDFPGAPWGALSQPPTPLDGGGHVSLSFDDGGSRATHASMLYVVLVDSEVLSS